MLPICMYMYIYIYIYIYVYMHIGDIKLSASPPAVARPASLLSSSFTAGSRSELGM